MPRFNGHYVVKASHLTWRNAMPEKDRDLSGEPVPRNYVAFLRRADCRDHIIDGRRYSRDKDLAPCIPVKYLGTTYALGEPQHMKVLQTFAPFTYLSGEHPTLFTDAGKPVNFTIDDYQVTPYYVVLDGYVYRGYVYRAYHPTVGDYIRVHKR